MYCQLWILDESLTHFAAHLQTAVLALASIRLMLSQDTVDLSSVHWHLRPHHQASDFSSLLRQVRKAFEQKARTHWQACPLCQMAPAIIIDGKGSLTCALCNERSSGSLWCEDLRVGVVTGCTERPVQGGLYCQTHLSPLGALHGDQERDCRGENGALVTDHRQVMTESGVHLEFMCEGHGWMLPEKMELGAIRSYELSLQKQRNRVDRDVEECGGDERRFLPEHLVQRKAGGILIAVSPCLRVIDAQPMYNSESPTQVLMLVWRVLRLLQSVTFVVYDFACGMLRTLRRRMHEASSAEVTSAWAQLLSLAWVIDRLHFGGHGGLPKPQLKLLRARLRPIKALCVEGGGFRSL